MDNEKKVTRGVADYVLIAIRVIILLLVCSTFFAAFNPTYIFSVVDSVPISKNTTLFTAAVSKTGIVNNVIQSGIANKLLHAGSFTSLRIAAIIILLGIIVAGVAACISVGSKHMKRLSTFVTVGAAVLIAIGALIINSFYNGIESKVIDTVPDVSGVRYEISMDYETSEATRFPENSNFAVSNGNVFKITIDNNSGLDVTGWAVKIPVPDGFSTDNIKYFNIWKSTRKANAELTLLQYNTVVEDGYLYISPNNYVISYGELTTDDTIEVESKNDDAVIKAGSKSLTLVVDGLDEAAVEAAKAGIEVFDGKASVPLQWEYPSCLKLFFIVALLLIVLSIVVFFTLGELDPQEGYFIETKYQLFLMFLPFILLIAAFSYLPLYGWRYAFFDDLKLTKFVGFKYFKMMFQSEAYVKTFGKVMLNTLAMSGLGLATSWLPMVFAIFLNEVKSTKFKRFVTTFSTIPNFISWVLVYAIAFPIFTGDGLINTLFGGTESYLSNSDHLWLKMLAWGTWKGIGWSAIIYISGIAGIDQQLYEAASIDGADRFQRMWHITLPGLLPTYVVMLVMSIAGILSNGMDQYLVFSNPATAEDLNVLDLYVYRLGIEKHQIAFSTVVGMSKSIISIILFFAANSAAKAIRGNGIV